MSTSTFFPGSQSKQPLFPSPSLTPGTYRVTFEKAIPGDGKSYNGEPRPTLSFRFNEPINKIPIHRTFTASVDKRSALMAFLKEMAGDMFSETVLGSQAEAEQLIMMLMGKEFLAKVGQAKNPRYVDIVGISPAKEGE
jgi:hypothetical protein